MPLSSQTQQPRRLPAQLFAVLYYCRSFWLFLRIPRYKTPKRLSSASSQTHNRYPVQTPTTSKMSPALPRQSLAFATPPIHDPFLGFAVGKERRTPRSRSRIWLGLGFTLGVCVLFLAQQVVHLNGGIFLGIPFLNTQQVFTLNLNVPRQQSSINASKNLARLSQLDSAQYSTQSEYDTWAYSACSSAALTEIFNAYGQQYRVTDVLKVEAAIGEITPQLGLMEDVGIEKTAAKFGFQTNWGDHWSLDQVLSNANAGHPVLVGWPPDRYEGGHIVVVTGGNANTIFLADTSRWNRPEVSVSQFLQWWGGFAAVITPV